MNRFNSTEEVGWDTKAEFEGRLARMGGFPLSVNPYTNPYHPAFQNWFYKSWVAGWCDADMDPNAPKKPIL